MDKLNKDIFYLISQNLNLSDLLSFCESVENKFDNDSFWSNKIRTDFPDFKFESPKDIYVRLYWTSLKNQLQFKGSIEELLKTKTLSLYNNELTEIPKELGNLSKLEKL